MRGLTRRPTVARLLALGALAALHAGPAWAGAPGPTIIIDQSPVVSVAANSSDGANANCGDDYPTGGGFEITNASVPFPAHVYRSAPQFGTEASASSPRS